MFLGTVPLRARDMRGTVPIVLLWTSLFLYVYTEQYALTRLCIRAHLILCFYTGYYKVYIIIWNCQGLGTRFLWGVYRGVFLGTVPLHLIDMLGTIPIHRWGTVAIHWWGTVPIHWLGTASITFYNENIGV